MRDLTTAEVAKVLGISPITIRWHIAQGNITAKKFGRDWMISVKNMNKLASLSRKPRENASGE